MGIRVRCETTRPICFTDLFRLVDIAHALGFGGILLLGGAVVSAVHTSLEIAQALNVCGGSGRHTGPGSRAVSPPERLEMPCVTSGLIQGGVLCRHTEQRQQGDWSPASFCSCCEALPRLTGWFTAAPRRKERQCTM